MSHWERVRDDGVLCLLSHCPSLSILILHGCPLLTSPSKDIASRGHKIKSLGLYTNIGSFLVRVFVCSYHAVCLALWCY
ncbi:hypothetical protein GBAR_LOCUS14377 [Geodia barretti]|nr:hypothetical protein GBAR_LOCUS14377 [Geodia barretti]